MKRKLKNIELNRISVEEYKKSEKLPVVIILDNIRSLYNVGAVFRTADAFLAHAVYLCGITACPPHREIHKTALGATNSVDWEYFSSTQEAVLYLKKNNYHILAVEQCTDAFQLGTFSFNKNKKYGLVFGNEIGGVSEEIIESVDNCLEIPQYGTKHSLNIAVSVGVIMWDVLLQSKITNHL